LYRRLSSSLNLLPSKSLLAMAEIPKALDADLEDVAWALSTADSLWKRGDQLDAIVWLRRGAEAASDGEDDDRALMLAKAAAELKDWLEAKARYTQNVSHTDVVEVDADADVPTAQMPDVEPVRPPHAHVHVPAAVSSRPLPQFGLEDDEEGAVSLAPSDVESLPPPAVVAAPSERPLTHPVSLPVATLPPVRMRTVPRAPETVPQYTGKVPVRPSSAAPPKLTLTPALSLPFVPKKSSPPPPVHLKEIGNRASQPPTYATSSALDFTHTAVLSALPVPAKQALASAASVISLMKGEEVPSAQLALTFVISGEVTVSATVVDAAALTLRTGELVRSRGTIGAHLAIRLIAASDHASVATWSESALGNAIQGSPATDVELRLAGNRIQAICGATIGPLGDRLDAQLIEQVTSKLTATAYDANEIVLSPGASPGILLVGAGELVVHDGRVIPSGDFVFPELALGGGKAAQAVRAGEGGTVVLSGSRSIVQELLATSPSLVEILAGM
jgi:hypothetical protein